mmetsp:Transcript_26868/g.45794  ORF Transcript_26868/g.45794 Transcript_26868/m.45794 type:complete len:260 (+) Transcript_26868:219-998(+)|eukprot:CAMPEP_0183731040 /NCGR_PEP_ID=MMETSP0737-20130205/34211_1 /TAXON_ID=385413 /ORGANISM="Thalassiosira miniscula, Strain CCMP1093" /LENGTH=259 /DNA_ID=CAMNT_0025963667 /DNA_START=143 /DNA_END=922 /DNA_ORIENTATION=-
MPPIINASASHDEDPSLNGTLAYKESFGHRTDAVVVPDVAVGKGGEGYDAAIELQEVSLHEAHQMHYGRRKSNLFADENEAQGTAGSSNPTPLPPPSGAFVHQGLSLMQSFSPPPSPDEDTDLQVCDGDEFAILQRQIDADEQLARQLQEEEDKRNQRQKSKPKVVATFVDSWLGEPLALEVKNNYRTVNNGSSGTPEAAHRGSSLENEITESVSRGMSMITNSFKRFGGGITDAATNFFGDDLKMQVKSKDSQYRNAV